MRKTLLALLCLLATSTLPAQDRTEKAQSVNLYLLGVEYRYEIPLAKKWTITPHVNLDGVLGWERGLFLTEDFNLYEDDRWYYALRGAVGADLRFYYNLSRRMEQGRPTGYNSGNFWAVDVQYLSKTFLEHKTSSAGLFYFSPYWGIRRVYRGKWLLEVNLGYQFGTRGGYWDHAAKVGMKMGFVF